MLTMVYHTGLCRETGLLILFQENLKIGNRVFQSQKLHDILLSLGNIFIMLKNLQNPFDQR